MAKISGSGVNKSRLIRDIRGKNVKLMPAGIVELLKTEHGIEVSSGYVSTVLSQAKSRKSSGKDVGHRGRPRKSNGGTRSRPAGSASVLDKFSVEMLINARKLANAMGGIDMARAALDALARIDG